MFEYKGYQGVACRDANIFFGEVANLRDVITFQGTSVKELVQSFRDSVDEYLKFCEELGRTPERPFTEKLNVQITPQIHREIANQARRRNMSRKAAASDTL